MSSPSSHCARKSLIMYVTVSQSPSSIARGRPGQLTHTLPSMRLKIRLSDKDFGSVNKDCPPATTFRSKLHYCSQRPPGGILTSVRISQRWRTGDVRSSRGPSPTVRQKPCAHRSGGLRAQSDPAPRDISASVNPSSRLPRHGRTALRH